MEKIVAISGNPSPLLTIRQPKLKFGSLRERIPHCLPSSRKNHYLHNSFLLMNPVTYTIVYDKKNYQLQASPLKSMGQYDSWFCVLAPPRFVMHRKHWAFRPSIFSSPAITECFVQLIPSLL